jgi:hypothetical protein
MVWTPPTEPAFEIVLDDVELENLGLFIATISQIDHIIYRLIGAVSGTRELKLLALIEGSQLGQRIAILRRLAGQIPDKETSSKIKELCSTAGSLAEKRNHILHGVWGLQYDPERHSLHPACAYERNRSNPIFSTQLPELCERSALFALKAFALLKEVEPNLTGEAPVRLILMQGTAPTDRGPPSWQPKPSRRSLPPNPESDRAK